MSTATIETSPSAQAQPAWRPRRWTTAEFDALLTYGLLVEGSKTFLWDGEIVEPRPENEPHANAQDKVQRFFIRLLPEDEWTIRPAHPLSLRDGYKPQTDLVILLKPRAGDRRRTPTADDAALVVEVADGSDARDAGEKHSEYAKAGIPRYWIVNLIAKRIEVYSDPINTDGIGRYQTRADYALDGAVPLTLARGGEDRDFGALPVMDVLCDSLEGM